MGCHKGDMLSSYRVASHCGHCLGGRFPPSTSHWSRVEWSNAKKRNDCALAMHIRLRWRRLSICSSRRACLPAVKRPSRYHLQSRRRSRDDSPGSCILSSIHVVAVAALSCILNPGCSAVACPDRCCAIPPAPPLKEWRYQRTARVPPAVCRRQLLSLRRRYQSNRYLVWRLS